MLISVADRSAHAARAIDTVMDRARRLLNDSRPASALDQAEYALLTGPLLVEHFIARRGGSDSVVQLAVQAVLDRRT